MLDHRPMSSVAITAPVTQSRPPSTTAAASMDTPAVATNASMTVHVGFEYPSAIGSPGVTIPGGSPSASAEA